MELIYSRLSCKPQRQSIARLIQLMTAVLKDHAAKEKIAVSTMLELFIRVRIMTKDMYINSKILQKLALPSTLSNLHRARLVPTNLSLSQAHRFLSTS